MRFKWVPLLALVIGMGAWMVTTALHAQSRSRDANISMIDKLFRKNDTRLQPVWRMPRRGTIPRLELLHGRCIAQRSGSSPCSNLHHRQSRSWRYAG